MANIEEIKAERPLLEIGKRIPEFARMGWEEIPEDDRDVRLKWYGVFHRKQTPGHFMMRIRIPNGIASAEQVRTLAGIANEFGRGAIDITTRQQVQLRWIRIENVPEIIDRLGSAGLLTLQTGMDNIRNLAGCPVAGLTPTELFDASPVVQAFNEMFVGNPEFVNLPRKMNITITGCLDNCTHAETQDIALVPATKQRGSETVAGFNVLVGGKMGSGGYSIAQPLAFVEPADAPRLLATIVLLFRDFGPREARNRSRLAFLIEDWGLDRFKTAVEDGSERSLEPPGEDARTGTTDHIGVFRQRDDRMYYVGLLVPMGRTNGGHLLEIARLSETYGSGGIRFTTGQNLIITDVPQKSLAALLDEPLLRELSPAPSQVMRGSVSCTGTDFCALATIETKGRALQLARTLEKSLGTTRPISINWSGCPAGCGLHQAADIGLLGRKKRVGDQVIEAVDVFIGGSSGPGATPGIKILEGVPCDELAPVVSRLVVSGAFRQVREQVRKAV